MLRSDEAELTQIACPDCGTTDWVHDGYAVHPGPDGTVARQRFAPTGHSSERRWQCRGCASAIEDADRLARRLTTIQTARFD